MGGAASVHCQTQVFLRRARPFPRRRVKSTAHQTLPSRHKTHHSAWRRDQSPSLAATTSRPLRPVQPHSPPLRPRLRDRDESRRPIACALRVSRPRQLRIGWANKTRKDPIALRRFRHAYDQTRAPSRGIQSENRPVNAANAQETFDRCCRVRASRMPRSDRSETARTGANSPATSSRVRPTRHCPTRPCRANVCGCPTRHSSSNSRTRTA